MTEQHQEHGIAPDGGTCKGCTLGCKLAGQGAQDLGLSPGRAVACAAGIFLLPLALACAGAVLGGRGPVGQIAGCLAGLVGGIALAVGVVRLVGLKERS